METATTFERIAAPSTILVNGIDRPVFAARPRWFNSYTVLCGTTPDDYTPYVVWTAYYHNDGRGWIVESGDYCRTWEEAKEAWETR